MKRVCIPTIGVAADELEMGGNERNAQGTDIVLSTDVAIFCDIDL